MLHWAGSVWTQSPPVTNETLTTVWALSPMNVWAAAATDSPSVPDNDTFLFHYDGETWSAAKAPPSLCPHKKGFYNYCSGAASLWSDGTGKALYLLTDGGNVFRNDGSMEDAWTQIGFPAGSGALALGGVTNAGSSATLWLGGAGTLRYYQQP
jgi:hypothetical protein